MMKKFKFSPSVLFILTFIAGISLSWILPVEMTRFIEHDVTLILGLSFLFISLILNFMAYRMFKDHATPHAPFSTPTNLIDKGIFAFSRNPVYLALVLSQCGLGFVFDTVWLMLMAIILLIFLHFFIVLDEEKMLQNRFKEKYECYKERTRRWF